MLHEILFYAFGIFALTTGFFVVVEKNPIHAVFFLVLCFVNAAGMLLMVGAEFLAFMFLVVYVDWSLVMQPVTNMELFGNFLFTHGFPYFILSGFILFVSMIGAIVLTLHRQEYTKRQDIYTQVSRSVMIRARTV